MEQTVHMMVKLLGAVCAMAGACGGGFWMAARKKHRLEILREWEQSLLLLGGEIEYAASDMIEIFDRLSDKTAYLSGFFAAMAKKLAGRQGCPLWEIWTQEMKQDRSIMLLEQEDRALWREVGMHLGTLDRQTQLQTLRVQRERLCARIRAAETAYPSQARVYRIVGITGGAFVMILLL